MDSLTSELWKWRVHLSLHPTYELKYAYYCVLAAILESELPKLLQLLKSNSTVDSVLYFWLQVTYEKYLWKMHIHHERIINDVEDEEG